MVRGHHDVRHDQGATRHGLFDIGRQDARTSERTTFIEQPADFRRLVAFGGDDTPVLQGRFRREGAQVSPGEGGQDRARIAIFQQQVGDLTTMEDATALHIGREQLFLAFEIVIKRTLRAAEFRRDRRHRGAGIAFRQEDIRRHVEDGFAAVFAAHAPFGFAGFQLLYFFVLHRKIIPKPYGMVS